MRIKPPHLGTIWLALIVTCLCLITVTLTGCSADGSKLTPEQARELLTTVAAESAELDTVIAQAEAQLAMLPEGEQRTELLAKVEDAVATKAKLDTIVDDINAATADADDWLSFATAALTASGKAVPPPYGVAVGLAGIFLGAIGEARKRRTQAAAASVIESIEDAKSDNEGVIDFNDRTTKAQLRASMSTPARELVANTRYA